MTIATGYTVKATDLSGGKITAAVNFGGYPTAATSEVPGPYEFGIRTHINIASVVRNNPGDYTVNFAEPMSSPNYVVAQMSGFGSDPNLPGDHFEDNTVSQAYMPRGGLNVNRTINYCRINTGYSAPNAAWSGGADAGDISLIFVDAPSV